MSGPTLNRVVADFSAAITGDSTMRLKDLRNARIVGLSSDLSGTRWSDDDDLLAVRNFIGTTSQASRAAPCR